MVYMCGSDLESRFGFASRDLLEMLSSGVDFRYTNLLVMIGGAKEWALGFEEDETAILELGASGIRTVWRSEQALSMADSETLGLLLDCAYSRYPADRYALIIWDHGGGPIEGVCYDELFPGKVMTLPALRNALRAAGVDARDRRLSWIGFDACMMANVETCWILRDYADYLIASQEEEPSGGWDYSFLKGLESDPGGADTGRRIIDAYFSQDHSEKDVLTLSCIDLKAVWAVRNALNQFFGPLVSTLTDETFSELSRQRHRVPGFGRAEYNAASDFDLVDLLSLSRAYGDGGNASRQLERAVGKAVVYTRSNLSGATGLSVYHPCYNREKFTGGWADVYSDLFSSMSVNYVSFIKRYGRIFTGARLGDWSGLETRRETDADGNIRFSLTLSEEQAANLEHATLILISQEFTENGGLGNSYYKVWETPYLEPDGDRTLSVTYPGKAIFAVDDETGEILAGPLNCSITHDGKLQIVVLYWDYNGILDEDLLTLMYSCSLPEDVGTLEIDRICAYDELTQDYSRRMTLDEQMLRELDYSSAVFYILNRSKPDAGDELPGYTDWPSDGRSFMYSEVRLPRSWHLEARKIDGEPEALFAAFQLSDTQGLRHSSSLCRAFPESIQDYEAEIDCRGGDLQLQAAAQAFAGEDCVCLSIDVLDPPAEIYSFEAENVVVNSSLAVAPLRAFSTDGTLFLTLPRGFLPTETEIRSIDFRLSASRSDYRKYCEQSVHLTFPVPVLLKSGPPEPLASALSGDGLLWRIWNVEQKGDDIFVFYDVTNETKQKRSVSLRELALGPCQMSAYGSAEVNPGMTVFCRDCLSQPVSHYDEGIRRIASVKYPIALLGTKEFDRIRLRYEDRDSYPRVSSELSFSLAEARPFAPALFEEGLERIPVLSRDPARIELSQWTVYQDSRYKKDAISLGLWFWNNDDSSHSFLLDAFSVNGVRTANNSWMKTESFSVLGGSATLRFIEVELPTGVRTPGRVSFTVFLDNEYLADVEFELPA